jgi:excisionase family DNA binding protein
MERLALSIAEASAAARIGRTRIYELIASGELKAVKIGRSTRIRASDLQSWLESLPVIPATGTPAKKPGKPSVVVRNQGGSLDQPHPDKRASGHL